MDSKSADRIIVLVDMDCFYVQVEQKLCPEYQNRPCAVVQYNTWKGGGIIAVNYEARAKGVKKGGTRGEDAQRLCPDIHLFRVPEVRGKADLTRYREAGASVIEVLCEFSDCVERASIDEAYIDVTAAINLRMQNSESVSVDKIANTFVVGWEKDDVQNWLQTIYEEESLYNDRMLALTAVMVEEMRAAVYEKTGYRCSAGIAHNKMLAKLSCGLNKPNKQTLLPESSVPLLYNNISVNKVRNLGGKFGELVMQKFDAKTMGDLMKISKIQFVTAFGEKNGSWIYNLSRGIENEPVIARQLPKSIGCGKNFPGKSCLNTKEKVLHWITQLSTELEERLLKDQENNKRAARLLTINLRYQATSGFSVVSRSCPIYLYDAEKIAHDTFAAIQKFNTAKDNSWSPPIWSLAIAAGKFEDKVDNASCDIQNYFVKAGEKASTSSDIDVIVDLIDSDKDIIKTSVFNNSPIKKRPGDIASFFSCKAKSDVNYITDKNSDGQTKDTKVISDSVIEVPLVRNDGLKELQPLVQMDEPTGFASTSTDTSSNCGEGKKKGFFSRKLEEETNASIEEPTINQFVSTDALLNNNSSGSKKKGFFARKLEERNKLLNENIKVSNSNLIDNSEFKNNSSSDVPLTNITVENERSEPSTSYALPIDIDESSQSLKDEIMNLDPELTKPCQKCNKIIPIWEEEEHLDYHMALDLSRELSKESSIRQAPTSFGSLSARPASKSKKTEVKSGRKRGSGSKSSSSRAKKLSLQKNTLDSFIKS